MYFFLTILILFLAVIFQATFIPHLAIWQVAPNLVLIIILSWSILTDSKKTLGWALIAGLLLDLFSGLPFGVLTLSLVLIAYIVNLLAYTILGQANFLVIGAIGFGGTIIYNLFIRLFIKLASLLNLTNLSVNLGYDLWRLILPEAVYNTIIIFIIFWLMKKFKRWLGQYQQKPNLPR